MKAEQISLETSLAAAETAVPGILSDKDGFDLCHAYRACSDAMQCICPEGVDFKNCRYAKKLKAGVCFYGKNSAGFDKNGYKEFCETVASLSADDKKAFEYYILKLIETRRETNLRLDYSANYKTLDSAGLIRLSNSAKVTLDSMKAAELRQIIKERFLEEERSDLNIKLAERKGMIDFIMNHCADVTDSINRRYSFVSINNEFYRFYFEYYYDFSVGGYMTHEEWMSTVNSEFQEEKLRKAALGELTPLSIDRENKTAEFSSRRGIYNTSLSHCTCGSFIRDKLPCKHIYRLAMEVGEIEAQFETAPEKIAKPSSGKASHPTGQERHNAFINAIELMEPSLDCLALAYNIICDKTAFCNDITKVDVMFDNGMIEIAPDRSRDIVWRIHHKNIKNALLERGYVTKNNEKLTNDYIDRNAEEICELLYPNIKFTRASESGYLKIAPTKIKTYLAYRLGKRQPDLSLVISNEKSEWKPIYNADDDVVELLLSNIRKYGAVED